VKTPILDYIKSVMQENMIRLDGVPGGWVTEEVWLSKMISRLRERYKKGGII
jgi:hypothetical protein